MPGTFRLLFIGDVVGQTGRETVVALVPELRRELCLDAVIVNGENSADNGFGATAETASLLLSVADFVTLGDHAFDQADVGVYLEHETRIIRPANLEGDLAGRGWGTFDAGGVRVGVGNLVGRLFMRPKATSPFEAADAILGEMATAGSQITLIDLQAEATSEKQAMGWYLDGRVTALVGTHTHVPTADARVLPGGSAYVSDVGMTGGRDSIIGFGKEGFLGVFRVGEQRRPSPAPGPGGLDAVLIEANVATGHATAIERVYRGL